MPDDTINRAICVWIRDTVPVAAKLTLQPGHVATLVDDIIDALHDAGLAIVPRKATEAQLRAGQEAWLKDPLKRSTTLYAAMVEAGKRGSADA